MVSLLIPPLITAHETSSRASKLLPSRKAERLRAAGSDLAAAQAGQARARHRRPGPRPRPLSFCSSLGESEVEGHLEARASDPGKRQAQGCKDNCRRVDDDQREQLEIFSAQALEEKRRLQQRLQAAASRTGTEAKKSHIN